MSRGKKKESLTPEERLQAALVPESEQPYPVPGNWCWVRLGFLLQSSKEKTDEFSNADLKYVGLEHMQKDGGIVAYDSAKGVKSLKNVFHPQQILYGKLRPYLNKHDIATFDGVCSTDILVFNIASDTIPKFINFFLDQDTFIEYAVSNSKGINLPRVSESIVLDAKCPLPPLVEQQRIVDRIESLFTKLGEAKQKAQDALDSFETRKAAILHKAFTGELTAQWRKEHGVGMESWERLKLGEIGTLERGRSQHRPRNDPRLFGGPYPFIQTGDVASANVYITEHHQTLSEFGMEQSRMFSAGTLCITIAANIGDVAILSYDCCFPDSVVGFIPNSRSISKFIYYMMSVLQKELEDNAPATAQKNINLKILNGVEMNIPPVIEQTEIVRILDDLLAKEQQAKEAAEGVLEQIDLIKKTILARAFCGELGTNNPGEESAVELVKKSLKEVIKCENPLHLY